MFEFFVVGLSCFRVGTFEYRGLSKVFVRLFTIVWHTRSIGGGADGWCGFDVNAHGIWRESELSHCSMVMKSSKTTSFYNDKRRDARFRLGAPVGGVYGGPAGNFPLRGVVGSIVLLSFYQWWGFNSISSSDFQIWNFLLKFRSVPPKGQKARWHVTCWFGGDVTKRSEVKRGNGVSPFLSHVHFEHSSTLRKVFLFFNDAHRFWPFSINRCCHLSVVFFSFSWLVLCKVSSIKFPHV